MHYMSITWHYMILHAIEIITWFICITNMFYTFLHAFYMYYICFKWRLHGFYMTIKFDTGSFFLSCTASLINVHEKISSRPSTWMRGRAADCFPGGKAHTAPGKGDGSRLYFVNSWAMKWSQNPWRPQGCRRRSRWLCAGEERGRRPRVTVAAAATCGTLWKHKRIVLSMM